MACDIHPDCQAQGCEFDPVNCPRAVHINGFQHKPKPPEPPESAKLAWGALCELERRLAFTHIECRTCGLDADECRCHPGKYVVTCNPAPDSWVRRKFEEPK